MAKQLFTSAVAPSFTYPTSWATKRAYAHFATNFGARAEGVNG
ncbi:MAG: hypothetical protein ACKO8C_04250 [Candidatus Nanopelagicaceae bacterium]